MPLGSHLPVKNQRAIRAACAFVVYNCATSLSSAKARIVPNSHVQLHNSSASPVDALVGSQGFSRTAAPRMKSDTVVLARNQGCAPTRLPCGVRPTLWILLPYSLYCTLRRVAFRVNTNCSRKPHSNCRRFLPITFASLTMVPGFTKCRCVVHPPKIGGEQMKPFLKSSSVN